MFGLSVDNATAFYFPLSCNIYNLLAVNCPSYYRKHDSDIRTYIISNVWDG